MGDHDSYSDIASLGSSRYELKSASSHSNGFIGSRRSIPHTAMCDGNQILLRLG